MTAFDRMEVGGGQHLRVLFMYLGRRGALGRFTVSLAREVQRIEGLQATFVVSRTNDCVHQFFASDPSALILDTFSSASPIAATRNLFAARRAIVDQVARQRPHAVVNLMPHVWSPFLVSAIRKQDTPYISVVHDAIGHPGDPTAAVVPWLRMEARSADLVVTLSRHVARQLVQLGAAPADRIVPLFLPDLSYCLDRTNRTRGPGQPLKLLFFGRILKYKGLPFLLDALELLRSEGVDVDLGVVGAGDIRCERSRLERLGAEIVNRWIKDEEVEPLLARYEAMVVPYVECSQSGVAATAFGSGMPVIGMPVGGIVEQVSDGHNGVLAREPTARSLADAIRRFAVDEQLYQRVSSNVRATAQTRSMHRFVLEILLEVVRLKARRLGAVAAEAKAFSRRPRATEMVLAD